MSSANLKQTPSKAEMQLSPSLSKADLEASPSQANMNNSPGSTSPSGKVKHGRRSLREGEHSNVPAVRRGWGEETEKKPLYSQPEHQASFEPIDPSVAAAQQQNSAAAQAAHEALVQEVAHAPTEFHSAMPKQSDLERATAAKFQVLLQQAAADGVDLQCLMATLTGQFDSDDVAWDPDQLLMQLTSEINDRISGADYEDDGAIGDPTQQQQQQQQPGDDALSPSGGGSDQQQQQPTSPEHNGGGDSAGDGGGGRHRHRHHHRASEATASPTNDSQSAEAAPAHGRRKRH